MDSNKYDFIVIGSGPGGQKAAIQAAKAGKKVAIIERDGIPGGHCVYRGTIPSKTLREAALTISRLQRNAEIFEFKMREDLEVYNLMSRLYKVLESHNQLISGQLQQNGVHFIHGRASLINKNKISIAKLTGETLEIDSDYIVLAPGSRPRTPNDIDVDHEHILDSDSILNLVYIPQSMIVLGGGVIACEYATIFALLGTKVYMLDKANLPINFIDEEIVNRFLKTFTEYGGEFIGEETYEYVKWDGVSQVETKLKSGRVIKTDKAFFALGRVANIEKLNLENAGVELVDNRYIKVDDNYKTTTDNIYAVGDVIGFPSLASSSMEQGRYAVRHALNLENGNTTKIFPYGIYAVPEIASIGLTEKEAIEKFGVNEVFVGKAEFEEVARAQIEGNTDGMLKIVADRYGFILGVQIIGEIATDLIHTAEIALLNGNTINIFLDNILNFPTMNEAYRIASLNLLNKLPKDFDEQ